MIRTVALAAAAGLGLLLQACGAAAPDLGTVALVSGRDDHGLLERPALGLQASPTDRRLTGSVQDGAFVRVVGVEGPWRRVRTIAPSPAEGWLDEHSLRGEAVRNDVEPRVRVRFTDAEIRDGTVTIRVRDPSGADAWVPASALREVGAR